MLDVTVRPLKIELLLLPTTKASLIQRKEFTL